MEEVRKHGQIGRAAMKADKDVKPAQRHRPGEAAQSDFTSTSELAVTIAGARHFGMQPRSTEVGAYSSEHERIDRATPLRRVWGVDVLACVRCGDRLRRITVIEVAVVIAKILAHVGLDPVAPRAARARFESWEDSA